MVGSIRCISFPFQTLQKPSGSPTRGEPGAFINEMTDDEPDDAEEFFRCGQCRKIITSRSNECNIDGSHIHTFANPMGIVYQILCFRYASGCEMTGPATDDFSWFSGYQWQIADCRSCGLHLGWFFSREGDSGFFGLIEDRLKRSA